MADDRGRSRRVRFSQAIRAFPPGVFAVLIADLDF
jgi:hypothetical protein